MKRNGICIVLLAIGMSLGLMAATAVGGMLNLSDGNSTVTIDPTGSDGVNYWSVNGVNQLVQQWFWYRIGGGPGAASSIDTLGTPTLSGTNSDNNAATLSYSNSALGLGVKVAFGLTGGTPLDGQSDLSETIKITNSSSSAQTISFFQYSNFALQGILGQDSVAFPYPNEVTQTNANSSMTETIVSPNPSYYEANNVPNTLTNFASPSFGHLSDQATAGPPGGVTWAYEWDKTINPGQSFIISKDLELSVVPPTQNVPEPSSLALLFSAGLGLIGLPWVHGARWRRRRA